MNRETHLVKARNIINGLKKLPGDASAVCIVDGSMIAGYHLGNALLHEAGVSAEDIHFNTPSKLDRPVTTLPPQIRPAFEAFAALERLRAEYVRGPRACSTRTAAEAWEHMEIMMRYCRL